MKRTVLALATMTASLLIACGGPGPAQPPPRERARAESAPAARRPPARAPAKRVRARPTAAAACRDAIDRMIDCLGKELGAETQAKARKTREKDIQNCLRRPDQRSAAIACAHQRGKCEQFVKCLIKQTK